MYYKYYKISSFYANHKTRDTLANNECYSRFLCLCRITSGFELYISVCLAVVGQPALGELFEEWVGVELFYVEYACSAPFACQEHIGSITKIGRASCRERV